MNFFKICSFVITMCVIQSECDLIDSVIGTVKNTTNALRADVHNFIEYGNDLVFGEKVTTDVIPSENGQVIVTQKTEGLITGLLHKAKDAACAVKQKIHYMFLKDSEHPHKGIIVRIFDSATKKLNIPERVEATADPTNIVKDSNNMYNELLSEDSKVVRDNILKALYRNNTNVLNKLNLSQADIKKMITDVKNNVTNTVPTDAKIDASASSQIDVRSLVDKVEN